MSKNIIITGASRGLGKSMADYFAADNSIDQIISISRTPAAESTTDSRIVHLTCDLSTKEGIIRALDFVRDKVTSVNLLINNAGAISEKESYSDVSYEEFISSFTLHSISHFLLSRELAPLFPDGESNLIINIGSVYGALPDPYAVAYVASKATVPMITQLLAKELAPRIRVNSILPGHFDTDMTSAAPPDYVKEVVSKTPMNRLGKPEEIAQLIAFLWSTAGEFITGTNIRTDGGFWPTVS